MGEILTDRGFVFYSWSGCNRFEKFLEMVEIHQTHARPHHPQTLGKVEATNKQIQKELLRQQHFDSVAEGEEAIGQWVLARAEKCIAYYDLDTIAKSEAAFCTAVSRDDGRKNLSYFFVILKNIQATADETHHQDYCRKCFTLRFPCRAFNLNKSH